jgi:HKD family nuclease
MIFTFDRFSNSLKTGEEFDVIVGFIMPKVSAKSPASREE